MKLSVGTVIKQVGGKFTVRTNDGIIVAHARNLRQNGVLVGDKVEVQDNVITKVSLRKNQLIRPLISNIDQIVIIVANKPSTDFMLIDKLIIYANENNIDTIICVNKIEESSLLYNEILIQYEFVVDKIIKVSAKNGKIDELRHCIEGKTSVLAGQSAVGKSTIINALFKENIAQIGELSRIEKGKNTTRHTELYAIDEKTFLADTPGFSCLELINFEPEEVSKGYTEFYLMSQNCKYRQCDHIFVDKCDCEVLRQLENNESLIKRYERYKDLYIETREKWRKKYGK